MKYSAELVKSMFSNYVDGKVSAQQLAEGYRYIFENNLYSDDSTIDAMLECAEQLIVEI